MFHLTTIGETFINSIISMNSIQCIPASGAMTAICVISICLMIKQRQFNGTLFTAHDVSVVYTQQLWKLTQSWGSVSFPYNTNHKT